MIQKIPFDISEIRITKPSTGGFELDIILKSDTQIKVKFHEESLFIEAKAADGNLTRLKNIFRENIDNLIKENPEYFYCYSLCEDFDNCFAHILEDFEAADADTYKDAMELIRSCAVEKNIEFDGYFLERWSESADTIINFDEDYFDDPDKRDLYVFLSSIVDDEIFSFLKIAFTLYESEPITKDFVQDKIEYLTKVKGVRF